MRTMRSLDGRHKLAVIGAIICWGYSVWFSYLGFKIDSENIKFVGLFLAGIVTIVELVFNSQTGKLSMTLIIVGVLCYAYGIWTNITGFWTLQHPNELFVFWSTRSIMPAFVGMIMEVLPEPLLMWGLMSDMDGDFFGNLMGLWSGNLSYAKPTDDQAPRKYPTSIPRTQQARPTPRPQPIQQRKDPTYHPVQMQVRDDEFDEMEASFLEAINRH